MDVFGQKKQEIEQLVNYIIKITQASNSKWCVAPGNFSVTINGDFERTFSKAELESFELQIFTKIVRSRFG